MILCPAFLSEHRTVSQGLLSILGLFSFCIAYLKTCQQDATGFGQPALGELNLLNHRTHNSTVFFLDGSAFERLQ